MNKKNQGNKKLNFDSIFFIQFYLIEKERVYNKDSWYRVNKKDYKC